MYILLNGPLGIGKSTLAEALMERLDQAVMLDGDCLIAMNPPPADEIDTLHATIALLVAHHRRAGYRHFVINHLWRTRAELEDLKARLDRSEDGLDVRCFLLTLPLEENLERIRRRQDARAIEESEFEQQAVLLERELLATATDGSLGEAFDVSGEPLELVAALQVRLGLG